MAESNVHITKTITETSSIGDITDQSLRERIEKEASAYGPNVKIHVIRTHHDQVIHGGQSSIAPTLAVEPEHVSTGLIPGTKLYTDRWYNINLKANGLLTWSNNKVNGFNHAQIVWDSAASEYQSGARYYHDAQWKLVQTEQQGYVSIVNRARPDAVLTWAGKSPSGKYVVLYLDHATDGRYLAGGQYRDDCLWKIEEGGYTGYYILYNKKFPASGIVTYTKENVAAGRNYVQLYESGDTSGYKHDADYLWGFTEITEV